MPFASAAQRSFLYATNPKIAELFEKHTPKGTKLPEHVSARKDAPRKFAAEQCESCGKAFDSIYDKCPDCFPGEPEPQPLSKRLADAETNRRWAAREREVTESKKYAAQEAPVQLSKHQKLQAFLHKVKTYHGTNYAGDMSGVSCMGKKEEPEQFALGDADDFASLHEFESDAPDRPRKKRKKTVSLRKRLKAHTSRSLPEDADLASGIPKHVTHLAHDLDAAIAHHRATTTEPLPVTIQAYTDTEAPAYKIATGEINPYSVINKWQTVSGLIGENFEKVAREAAEAKGKTYISARDKAAAEGREYKEPWHTAGVDHYGGLTSTAMKKEGEGAGINYLRVLKPKTIGEPRYRGISADGTEKWLDPTNPEDKRVIETFAKKPDDADPHKTMRIFSHPGVKHVQYATPEHGVMVTKSNRITHEAPVTPAAPPTTPAIEKETPPTPAAPESPIPEATVPATVDAPEKEIVPPKHTEPPTKGLGFVSGDADVEPEGFGEATPEAEQAKPAATEAPKQSKSMLDEQVKGSRLGYHLGQIARKYKTSKPLIANLAKDGLKGLISSYAKLGAELEKAGDTDFAKKYRWNYIAKGMNLDRAVRKFVERYNVQSKDGGNHFRKLQSIALSGNAGKTNDSWGNFWNGLRDVAKNSGVFGTGSANDELVMKAISNSLARNGNRHEDLKSEEKVNPKMGPSHAERFKKKVKPVRFSSLDMAANTPEGLKANISNMWGLAQSTQKRGDPWDSPIMGQAEKGVRGHSSRFLNQLDQLGHNSKEFLQQQGIPDPRGDVGGDTILGAAATTQAAKPQLLAQPKAPITKQLSSKPPIKKPEEWVLDENGLGYPAEMKLSHPRLGNFLKQMREANARNKKTAAPVVKPKINQVAAKAPPPPTPEMTQNGVDNPHGADSSQGIATTGRESYGPMPTLNNPPTLRDPHPTDALEKLASEPKQYVKPEKSEFDTEHHQKNLNHKAWSPTQAGYLDLTHAYTQKNSKLSADAKASEIYPMLAQAKKEGYYTAIISRRDAKTGNSFAPVAAYVSKNRDEVKRLGLLHNELIVLRKKADEAAKELPNYDPKNKVKMWQEGGKAHFDGSGKTLIERAKEAAHEMRNILGHKQDIQSHDGKFIAKTPGMHVHGARLMLRHKEQPKRFAKQTPNPSLAHSLSQSDSQQQHKLREIAARILHKYKLTPHRLADAINDTAQNSQPGVAQAVLKPVSREHTNRAAAQYGLMSGQNSLLVFHGHPQGPDSLYGIDTQGGGENVRQSLDAHGIMKRVLLPTPTGFRVVIHDPGRKLRPNVEKFANSIGATVNESIGFGEHLGDGAPKTDEAAKQPTQLQKKSKPTRFGHLDATKPLPENAGSTQTKADSKPQAADHPVFDPQAHWEDKSTSNHVNPIWKVQDANNKMWFAKKCEGNPEEAYTDPAARKVLRHLGFNEVPETQTLIAQHRGEPVHMVVGPWKHLAGTFSNTGMAQSVVAQHDPQHITNLLTAEHLIHALDRNPGNYGYTNDDKIVPLDYGESWSVLPWREHPDSHDWLREKREPSPRRNELADIAKQVGLVGGNHPLDKQFLAKILENKKHIESIFENEVLPHLPTDDAKDARRVLAEKFAHIGELIKKHNPVLADLKHYRAMKAE